MKPFLHARKPSALLNDLEAVELLEESADDGLKSPQQLG